MARRNKTFFIADTHLGATYITDKRAHEQRFVDFLESIADEAARVYLLGDIFDYHFEYRNVIPARNLRTLGALGRLADKGIDVTWIGGNHDSWFRGTIADELGIVTTTANILPVTIDVRRFVLTHGDAVGPVSRRYMALRAVLRNPVARFLYAAVHPRWTTSLALNCSRMSRASQGGPKTIPWQGDDREPIYIFARDLASTPDAPDYIIAGHRHLPVDRVIPGTDTRLVILGDGYSSINYAVFDGLKLEVKTYQSEQNDIDSCRVNNF